MSQHSFKAVLLTAPGCVHCAALKKILEKFLTEGLLGQLDVIDASSQPEFVKQYSIKSVPWLKLDVFEFSGAQREVELRKWIARLNTPQGITAYLKHLLATGELDLVIRLIKDNPAFINNLLALASDEDKEIKIQLGVSAVFEELEGSPLVRDIVDRLGELAEHRNPKIRADIAHFLSLSHHEKALGFLRKLAIDPDREVREIASDALRNTTH
jgi:thioredoxin-like negative regulator of GroEL